MPQLTNKAKLEQAKKRLGITTYNPFDQKFNKSRNIQTDKKSKFQMQQKKKEPEPQIDQEKLVNLIDERITIQQSDTHKNYQQTQQIHSEMQNVKQQTFTDTQNKSKQDVQEIYMEIMQKSKQAKKERQLLKQELDAKIKKLDGTFNYQIQQAVPKGFNQQVNNNQLKIQFQEQIINNEQYNSNQLKHGELNPGTIEGQIKIGQNRLIQMNKDQISNNQIKKTNVLKKQVIQESEQKLGDDEDAQFIQEPEFEQLNESKSDQQIEEKEENEESETNQEIQLSIVNDNAHQQFSSELQQIPYALEMPENYEEYQSLLNKVNSNEEIVVLDRLIKTQSTFLDKNNQQNFERFISYTFKRINQLSSCQKIDYQRLDSNIRALKHQSLELPATVAAQFNGQFQKLLSEFQNYYYAQSIFPAPSIQFTVILRSFAICFIQTQYYKDGEFIQNSSINSYFLVLELLVFNSGISSTVEQLRYLLIVQLLISFCCQVNKFSGGILYGLQRLFNINTKYQLDNQQDDQDVQISFKDMLQKSNLVGQQEFKKYINQTITKLTKLTFYFFKLNFEFLPPCLANLLYQNYKFEQLNEINTIAVSDQYNIEVYQNEEDFITFNNDINFLKERQYQIKEQFPLVMKNFNPKRTNLLDFDKQRQVISDKYEKRKQKDEFRKEVKVMKQKQLLKQNITIQKQLELQKVKNHQLSQSSVDEKYTKQKKM